MRGRISQATIEDLLSRIDIVEIIQARVPLIKKGKNHQARCPFHDEKTPSFTVSQSKQFYYCFGCGAHGNAINFLMQYDRMEFLDALTFLAAQAGIELPQEDTPQADPKRQALYPLMEKISAVYQQNLRHSQPAIDYLKSRGLTGQIAKDFAIGYATAGWDDLSKQFDIEALINAGMAIHKNAGKTYDRFRHRIMFPIHDIRGRTIAFGGRSLGDDPPKYLNSPETTIFHKSNELYGLYEARKANRQLNRLLIVEGYLDVIALAQHELPYAVATLGTAINAKHIQKALRYTNELVFCFDGDNAGRQAAWKALLIALPVLRDDIHLRFLFLPDGEDPDSLIQKIKKTGFEARIEKADSLSDVFFNTLSQRYPIHSMDAKAQYAHQALQYINTMPKGIFYQLMQQTLAERLLMKVDDLEHLSLKTDQSKRKVNQKTLNPAQLATALLLQYPPLVQHITEINHLQNITLPGKTLLLRLLQRFRNDPELTTGKLLSSPISDEEKQTIARLTAIEFPLTESGLTAEFIGALKRLEELNRNQQLEALIQKAKSTELSVTEKQTLSQLLSDKSRVEG